MVLLTEVSIPASSADAGSVAFSLRDFDQRILKGLSLTMADINEAPLKTSWYLNGKSEILMVTRSHNTATFGGLHSGLANFWGAETSPRLFKGVLVPRLSPYPLTVPDCLFNSLLHSI